MAVKKNSTWLKTLLIVPAAGICLAAAFAPTSVQAQRPGNAAVRQAAPATGPSLDEKAQRVAQLENQASELFKQQEFDKTLNVLRQIESLDESVAPPDVVLADWFAQIGVSAGVAAQLERAVKNSPNDPEAYIQLASIAVSNGRIAEATLLLGRGQQLLEAYQKSPQRKDELHTLLLTAMASYSEANEDWKSVLGILQALEKKDDNNQQIKINIAMVFLQLGDEAQAEATLEKIFAKDPTMAPPKAIIADVFSQNDKKDRGLVLINASLQEYPKNAKNQEIAAKIFFRLGILDEAKKAVANLKSLAPDSSTTATLSGDIMLAEGHPAEAVAEFSRAIDLDSSDLVAGIGYTQALLLTGGAENAEKALSIMAQIVVGIPENDTALVHYAWALDASGKKDEALKVIQNVLPVWEADPNEALAIATCLGNLEDKTLARRLVDESLAIEHFTLRPYMETLKQKLGPAQ